MLQLRLAQVSLVATQHIRLLTLTHQQLLLGRGQRRELKFVFLVHNDVCSGYYDPLPTRAVDVIGGSVS